jgi:SAM-dependent methyltransferase
VARQQRRDVYWLRRRAKRLVRRFVEVALDKATGMDTLGYVPHAALEFDESRGKAYEASGWSTLLTLRTAFRELGFTDRDVFVDFGSGKGRAVYWAARYPFRRVIGVELSARLSTIARRNIDRNRHRLTCRDIELVTADVTQYAIPDDVTVVYLYNPFHGDIFADVVERLCASVRRNPRQLCLIYVNPVLHDLLAQQGFRVKRQGSTFRIYTYVPADAKKELLLRGDHWTTMGSCASNPPNGKL